MDLVPLQLKGIAKIVGNDDLALLELVTNDGLKQLPIVCESTMVHEFGLRLSNVPIRNKLLPEVLWQAFGSGQQEKLQIIYADFHEGEFKVFLHHDETNEQWQVRASDAILLALIGGIPVYAEQKVVDRCATPVDTSGKGVAMPLALLPTELLREQMEKAVANEDYEMASLLRDELKKRDNKPS